MKTLMFFANHWLLTVLLCLAFIFFVRRVFRSHQCRHCGSAFLNFRFYSLTGPVENKWSGYRRFGPFRVPLKFYTMRSGIFDFCLRKGCRKIIPIRDRPEQVPINLIRFWLTVFFKPWQFGGWWSKLRG
jgi:hypothetical protein